MAGKEDDSRYMGGPRPVGAIVPRLVRPAFRRRSPAGAMLMADWPAVVGPALAAIAAPKRLSSGTLTIACAGPVALELTHLAPELIARINAHLGRAAVERLRFVQETPAGGPAAPPRPRQPHPAALPGRVEAAIGRVPSGELRAALAKLARGVYRDRE